MLRREMAGSGLVAPGCSTHESCLVIGAHINCAKVVRKIA